MSTVATGDTETCPACCGSGGDDYGGSCHRCGGGGLVDVYEDTGLAEDDVDFGVLLEVEDE